MKYSAKGKTGFVFAGIGILGFPASLVSGNMPFFSALIGSSIWLGIGVLLIYLDKKNGGKKEKPPKPIKEISQPKPVHDVNATLVSNVQTIIPAYDESWEQWCDVHESLEQMKRIRRASTKEFMCRHIDVDSGEANFLGSDGDTYYTNLSSCTCPDFQKRGLPCKHMYYLANNMHLFYFENYLK